MCLSGNENAGMTIERELNALEDLGCNYFKIGERKLKGWKHQNLSLWCLPID